MPNGQIDPARLEGEALRQWYQRTPDQIEEERRLVAAKQHADFFGGPGAEPAKLTPPQAPAMQEGGVRYASLYAPPPDNLAELRRQQADLARTRRQIADQNSWMAIPALAPAAVLGLEGAALLAIRAGGARVASAPLAFAEREALQVSGQRAGQALSREAKATLREAGREVRARQRNVRGENACSGASQRPA